MTAPYTLMSPGERVITSLAAVVAVACLAVVLSTPLGGIHSIAVTLGPSMSLVVGLVAMRAVRRRRV